MPTTQTPAGGLDCDVLVLGSGSAGLTAALTASAAGLTTIIAEKAATFGGTTAMSGAGIWIPANHRAREAGVQDSAAEALDYIRAASPPGWEAAELPLWRRFVDAAPLMLRLVEARSPLRFDMVEEADPVPGLPGWKGRGRMVTPRPVRRAVLGPLARQLRPSMVPQIFTYHEVISRPLFSHPVRSALSLAPRLGWRWLTGARGTGAGLVLGLLKGCLDHGCRLLLAAEATDLIQEDGPDEGEPGRVAGAVVRIGGDRVAIRARRGVVIATGGFEWDAERVGRHFPGPVDFVASPRTNAGDGHRMAEAVGAWLDRMDQANLNPAVPALYEARPQGQSLFFHREPNAIIVGPDGRRFFDETAFNFGEVIDARDPATGLARHLPAWLVTDAGFLKRAPLVRRSRRHDRGWMRSAATIRDLAQAIGVPPDELAATVARYNKGCAAGADAEFGRGGSTGWPPGRGAAALAPIRRPPFLAIPFNRSFVSTKGGPRTNADGQVLRPDGQVIAGLYCAGVAMANPFGTRGIGAGTTLGPNMTWGYVCAQHMAGARGLAQPTANNAGTPARPSVQGGLPRG